ncbi:MAG TPA: hypothetical protein PK147_09605, partial [Saprospiraceae bacterium]|nr:hypothetical protein [Saprospiraceae bacterium]
LNDTGDNIIHKFSVENGTGELTEIGTPWMNAAGVVNSPHGIAADINGNLYISQASSPNFVAKFNCEGEKIDADLTTPGTIDNFIDGYFAFDLFSYDNYLYLNVTSQAGGNTYEMHIYDLCTGEFAGCQYPAGVWSTAIGPDGYWYGGGGTTIIRGSLDPASFSGTNGPNGNCGDAEVFMTTAQLGLDTGNGEQTMGVDFDADGYMYVVYTHGGGFSPPSKIVKIDPATKTVIAQSLSDDTAETNVADNLNWAGARGLVYSPNANLIYVSAMDDCIAAFDTDLNYVPDASNHVPASFAKQIGIVTECCPNVTPLSYNETICSSGNGEHVFLQDIFSCGDGIICDGQWTEESNTSGGNIVYNECDLSISVNGTGCATYKLSNTDATTRCGVYDITVNVCTEVPAATATPVIGTCTGTTANNDASISISGVLNADEANYSIGATYTGPDYGDASGTDISSGSGSITGLLHNTTYTVRVWNGANDCYIDYTRITPDLSCMIIDGCMCSEYIYLNGGGSSGVVHKFSVNTGGSMTEVLNNGNPWYPGAGVSELPRPHGLGYDINGFLYIGEHFSNAAWAAPAGTNIRKLSCDGNLYPSSDFVVNPGDGLFNITGYEGFIYANGAGPNIYKIDPCDGSIIGSVCLNGSASDDWGFYIDQNTGIFYATGGGSQSVQDPITGMYSSLDGSSATSRLFVFEPTDQDFIDGTCFDEFIPVDDANFGIGNSVLPDEYIGGVTTDLDGNIYLVQGNRDYIGTSSAVLKYSPAGVLLAMSPIDNLEDGSGYNQMAGIVYSEIHNRIYTSSLSPIEDCVYSFSTDLNDNYAAVAPDGNGYGGKGIAIMKECCPVATETIYDVTLCSTVQSEKVFLQELFSCGDGIVCEGQWAETINTSGGSIEYNECDLSVTINGSGCATYELSKDTDATGSQACGMFSIIVHI